jgi:AcrR family transcriptional regulator
MAPKVKSEHRPTLSRRAEQAAQTRERIVRAAGRLFMDAGYGSTSIVAIAREAGVAPETIYKAFKTKRRILQDLIDSSVVGAVSASPMPVLKSPAFQAIRDEPDQHRRLAMLAHLTRTILERAGPIHAVIRNAAATDPEIAALRLQQQAFRLRAQIEFVRVLSEAGPLRNGLTVRQGGYHYWILATPELQHILVQEQGWSDDRYEAWLRDALEAVLLPPTAGVDG